MPIFRKKMGKEEKEMFHRKFMIAQEKPDEIFDLTNCGLFDVPEKTYALCKVLQKEILLLQHNRLTSLKDGGKMEDLVGLKVLDLSYNQLTAVPKQIKLFVNLRKLDVAYNKIKELPVEIGSCALLQTLNLRGNRLTYLPAEIKHLRELRVLDICDNKDLVNLPVNLCYLKHLENVDMVALRIAKLNTGLVNKGNPPLQCHWSPDIKDFYYDKERIRYPPKDVSYQGIMEIKRWFMLIKGNEFAEEMEELSQKSAGFHDKQTPNSSSGLSAEDESFQHSIQKREKEREARKQKQLELEKRIQDVQTENAILLSTAAKERQKVLANVAFEEMRTQSELHRVYEEGEGNREKLLHALREDELSINDTVSLVLQITEKARMTEELLDELEADRERMDQLLRVTQEETDRLKKEDVIRSMTILMGELEKHQEKFEEYEKSRDTAAGLALRSFAESNQDVESLLQERDEHRHDLLQKIATEEESQMQVFKVLQFQKDSKLVRIRNQIELIEGELQRITMMEMEKRHKREDEDMDRLAEMRLNTAIILSQLIDEQEKREGELVKRLKEMEDYRDDDAKDYWLVQFQRLLDSKPQVLIDDENELDVYVVEILVNANAKEYLPMFGRRKITKEQMNAMTNDELKLIGVHDESAREGILSTVKNQISMDRKKEVKQSFARSKSIASDEIVEVGASAPPVDSLIARFEGECVVCLEEKPNTIFLNCGHVCTCAVCSIPLNLCPLCRQEISQKCRLFGA